MENINDSQRKITLGFKCLPILKARLSHEADEVGLTLSAYVESLVNAIPKKNDDINKLLEENQKLKNEHTVFTKRISVYENDYLKNLYNSYKNKSVNYTNQKGENIQKSIVSITDVYDVIIDSFKYKI
jgi:hypothetical protein